MQNVSINGLGIKAVDAEGKEIAQFEIIKIKDLYYGVRNIESTNREFLQLKVLAGNIYEAIEPQPDV